MKTIDNTEFEHQVPTKYYKGRVVDKRPTQMGHLLIQCDEVEEITLTNGIKTIKKTYNHSNFIVPKRRLMLFKEAQESVGYKKNYIFKMQEESKSKVYMVSAIFLLD